MKDRIAATSLVPSSEAWTLSWGKGGLARGLVEEGVGATDHTPLIWLTERLGSYTTD